LVDVTEPDYSNLSVMIKGQLKAIMAEYHYLDDRIDEMTKLISEVAHQHPLCRILLSIPGIGPINATAIYSAVGNGSQFNSGREMAVWLGLTPRQSSSGNKLTSGGITKRGDRYLRTQLVHGARSILWRSKAKTDQLNRWAYQVMIRRGAAKASVALAARLARLSWVLLQKQTPYVARK
jgi:transposase